MLAELAHRAEDGDPALRRRFSAPRLLRVAAIDAGIGIVAFVDQQHLAAVELDAGGARRGL